MADWKKRSLMKNVMVAELEPSGPGPKCPFHFGIRTYFGSMVESQDKEVIETVDYLEEDEPKQGCTWERACIWCGVPLLLLGVLAVLVGQLTPVREAVVARRGSLAYLDRKAIAYNQRLELCRLLGLAALCAAALLILLSFLISAYSSPSNQQYSPVFAGPTAASPIPLSGVLTTVQPPSSAVPPRRYISPQGAFSILLRPLNSLEARPELSDM